MVKNTETILIETLKIPVQERAALASRLLASLDEKVDTAWEQEIAKRLKEIDEGKVEMVPWEQVRAEMRGIIDGSKD